MADLQPGLMALLLGGAAANCAAMSEKIDARMAKGERLTHAEIGQLMAEAAFEGAERVWRGDPPVREEETRPPHLAGIAQAHDCPIARAIYQLQEVPVLCHREEKGYTLIAFVDGLCLKIHAPDPHGPPAYELGRCVFEDPPEPPAKKKPRAGWGSTRERDAFDAMTGQGG